jgi:uncharacterized damage-inducible protein DinB
VLPLEPSLARYLTTGRSLHRCAVLCDNFVVADLDISDIKDRAERGRKATLQALASVPEDVSIRDRTEDEWSTSRNLRHVAWVEHYWTLVAAHARDAEQDVVDLNREISYQLAVQASRLAGTPEAVLPKPPPYVTKDEAVEGLGDSRRRFVAVVESITLTDLMKRLTVPWGTVTVRWAVEHVVEHDWDHAVQITGLSR